MIKIIWLPGPRPNSCYYVAVGNTQSRGNSPFQKNYNPYWKAKEIRMNRDNPHRAMTLCHEMSHAIMGNAKDVPIQVFRGEVLAWRLAKSFCRPDKWHEPEAKHCLMDYAQDFGLSVQPDKLRILPINHGIKSQL